MPKPEKQEGPGPGRSTQDEAFTSITREIAARNQKAHEAARRARTVTREKQAAKKRRMDGV